MMFIFNICFPLHSSKWCSIIFAYEQSETFQKVITEIKKLVGGTVLIRKIIIFMKKIKIKTLFIITLVSRQ